MGYMGPIWTTTTNHIQGVTILRKSHKIVLKTYQHLVAFLAPGMDDMVQSQHGH